MKPTRVLVLALMLGGYFLGSAGHALSGTGHDAHDGPQEPRRRSSRDNETTKLFRLMGKNTIWRLADTVEMGWQTFHTQGLVKIGETFYVSAVEVIESTVRNGTGTDALYDFSIDRSTGAGRGWLFKFDAAGQLHGQIELTDGTKYHPGGIDYDGQYIWLAVAEYRPNSKSNIYRVDPDTLASELVFAENDHIGGIVHNVHRGTLHGVSWGSRRLYTWKVADRRPEPRVVSSDWVPNAQFYIDYQDCHYQGASTCCAAGLAATPRHSAISRSAAWIWLTCAALVSNTRFRSISSLTKVLGQTLALRSPTMRSGSSRSAMAPCARIS